MIALLLLSLAAQARTIGVVVGAKELWTDACAQGEAREACLDRAHELAYADDDAWRAAYFLETVTRPEDIRVLTEVDESTEGREFPGGEPSRPTKANLLATIRALRGSGASEPTTLILFFAAHGTPQEVHLADGRHDFRALRAEVLDALGPQDDLVLIADACNSARWRSSPDYNVRPMPYFPPVETSRGRLIEAVVDGITPEDDDVLGGVFTYLTLSAWMGAGDTNEDGVVSTQELQDQLFRYAAAGTRAPFAPVVRSPRGSSNYPLPERPLGGSIVVGGDRAARWVVLAKVAGSPEQGLPIGEVFTVAKKVGQLVVPPGEYTVIELPCLWDAARRAYVTVGDAATIYRAEVRRSESTALEGGEPVSLGPKGARGALGETTDNLPVAALEALPENRARYHGGARWWLGVNAELATPAMLKAGRDAPVLGASLSLRRPLASGRLQLTGQGGWLGELGGTQPSTMQMATMATTLQVLTFSRPHLYAGPVGGAHLDLGSLTATRGETDYFASYVAPGALVGLRCTAVPGQSSWSMAALWAPAWVRVDDEGEVALERWRAEPWQLRITLSGEMSW